MGSWYWQEKGSEQIFGQGTRDIRDLDLMSRLQKLRNGREFFNRGDDNNNNNDNNNCGNVFLSPPPSPPCFDFSDETRQLALPNFRSFLNDNVNNFPPPHHLLPPFPWFQNFFQPPLLQRVPDLTFQRKNDAVANTTQTMNDNRLVNRRAGMNNWKGRTNGKPRMTLPEGDTVFAFPKIAHILNNKDFEQKQEIKKTTGWWNKQWNCLE